MKINLQVYLDAAELQFEALWCYGCGDCPSANTSRYSCDNINEVAGVFEDRKDEKPELKEYQALYKEYFEPSEYVFVWWEMTTFGNECRILALLLMYEIAKDLNKPKKKRKKK